MSYLLAGGCSYTVKNLHYGTTFQYDRIHEIWKEADWDIWPEILGKKLNLTPIVYASGGLTNTLILEFIIDHLNQYDKPDMICVQLSDWCRTNIGLNNYIAHWRILQYLYKRNKINWGWMHGECCLGEGLEEDILPVEWSMGDYLINIKLHTEIWKKLSALVDICEYRKIPLYVMQGLSIVGPLHKPILDKKTNKISYFIPNTPEEDYADEHYIWFNKIWNIGHNFIQDEFNNGKYRVEYSPNYHAENHEDPSQHWTTENLFIKKFENLNKKSKYINLIGWPFSKIFGGFNWIEKAKEPNHYITAHDMDPDNNDNKTVIDYHPGPEGQKLFAKYFLNAIQ